VDIDLLVQTAPMNKNGYPVLTVSIFLVALRVILQRIGKMHITRWLIPRYTADGRNGSDIDE